MQGVAKLVEEGLDLAQGQQRGFLVGGLGEVGDDGYVWAVVMARGIGPLLAEAGHPGSGLLRRTGEEVAVEHGKE